MNTTTGQVLEGYTDTEKGAYLTAIASLATTDRPATEEEVAELITFCEAAELSWSQQKEVLHAASDTTGKDLHQSLDILKDSELKYSLIADLMTFSKTDSENAELDQRNISKIAKYLGINEKQKTALNDFADTAVNEKQPEVTGTKGFLPFSGVAERLRSVGINANKLLNGVLGFAAPQLLARMVSKGISGINTWRKSFQGAGRGLFGGSGSLGSALNVFSGGSNFATSGRWIGRALN
jgi:uncharacterized tellurite resistance protein B-like protein